MSVTTSSQAEPYSLGAKLCQVESGPLFVSHGQRVIQKYSLDLNNENYTLNTSFIHGTYVDDIIAKVESGSAGVPPVVHYYHTDRQYNVRSLTDASGNILELYAYTPYGKQTILDNSGLIINNSQFANAYGFTGRYLDSETGLWYFRARYFSDELGRFISRDPLGYIDGYGLYNGYFAEGFALDPSGECSFTLSDEFNEMKFKSGRVQKTSQPMTYSVTVNWNCTDDHYPDTTSEVNVSFNLVGALDTVALKIPFLSGKGINIGAKWCQVNN